MRYPGLLDRPATSEGIDFRPHGRPYIVDVEGLAAVVLVLVIVANSLAGLDRWRAAGRRAAGLAHSRRAAGVVTGTEPHSATGWHPVIRFTDDAGPGRERTVRAPARNREHWPRPHDTVAIRYDPQDPDWIAFDDEKYAGTATRSHAIAYFSWAAAMLVGLVVLLLEAR